LISSAKKNRSRYRKNQAKVQRRAKHPEKIAGNGGGFGKSKPDEGRRRGSKGIVLVL
jgi:hypothetical protein